MSLWKDTEKLTKFCSRILCPFFKFFSPVPFWNFLLQSTLPIWTYGWCTVLTSKQRTGPVWPRKVYTGSTSKAVDFLVVVAWNEHKFQPDQRGLNTKRPIIVFFFGTTKPFSSHRIRQARASDTVFVKRREMTGRTMDQISIKTPNPKCRLS